MTIRRTEPWGTLTYDTKSHCLTYEERQPRPCGPYTQNPVVLNVVVTHDCNMDCDHCVAKDFRSPQQQDIEITHALLAWINESPALVIVLTGGEPLLSAHEDRLLALLEGIRHKGLMVDTNGTIIPTDAVLRALRKRDVLVRVSLDSIRRQDDTRLRHGPNADQDQRRREHQGRLERIDWFIDAGINTSIQTVVYRRSLLSKDDSLDQMAEWLRSRGINKWYLQRLIPSYRLKEVPDRFGLAAHEYESIVDRLRAKCRGYGIECVAKRDRRHNSVFLLLGEGAVYTQGSAPGQKVLLGTIHEEFGLFDYVSASDHATRYYCTAVE